MLILYLCQRYDYILRVNVIFRLNALIIIYSMALDEIKKQYYTIGEVSDKLGLTASLIRYWETEFRDIQPKKNKKGNRVYTPKDIQTLETIKFLLKTKKYTIKGAQEMMKEGVEKVLKEKQIQETLLKIRGFLLEIKKEL